MPEIKNTFTSGRMNKDLDERLIPKGEYRDALNIDIATSESSDVGTVQNVMGNERITTLGITGQQCIGSIADTKNDKIYWFISGTYVDAIAEYDAITTRIIPVLVDVKPQPFSLGPGILNFQWESFNQRNEGLITGVNLIVDEDRDNVATTFLMWTDDTNEPKKINIERCKTGSTDFATTTTLEIKGQNKGNILEEHITTIKKSPLNSPNIGLSKTADDRPEDGSTTAWYTSLAGELTTTESLSTTTTSGTVVIPREAGDMILYSGIRFTANSLPVFRVGDELKLTASASETGLQETYTARLRLTSDRNIGTGDLLGEGSNYKTFYAEIISVSSNLTHESLTWDVELVQSDPMFELKFPRFGYRWKYVDGEYSCFSPFSKVAFLPDQDDGFEYNPVEAYNLAMVNTARTITIGGGDDLPFDTRPADVVEVDILYKESNHTSVYTVTSLKTDDDMDAVENQGMGYAITTEQVHALVPSNQLLRPWDNVPRQAKAQEITKNRIIYGNYLQNFNVPEEPSFIVHPHQMPIEFQTPTESLKSIRNYQIGVVFIDQYGRQTPVLSNDSGALRLDQRYAETANQLTVQVQNANGTPLFAPYWATHYRYFIKEPSLEYYNLAMDRFYTNEGDHVWLSFPSAERNKVDEETYLILKKNHDSDNAPDVGAGAALRYKILDISNEAPKTIRTRKTLVARVNTTFGKTESDTGDGFPEEGAMYINIPYVTIKDTAIEPMLLDNPNEIYIKVSGAQSESEYYQLTSIESIGVALIVSTTTDTKGYWKFNLKKIIGPDIGFTLNAAGAEVSGLSAKFYKETIDDVEEFEGRFFVKIRRDNDLEQSLLSYEEIPTYVVDHDARLFFINYYKTGETHPKEGDFKVNCGKEHWASATKDIYNSGAMFAIDNAVYYKSETDMIGTINAPMKQNNNKFTIRLCSAGTQGTVTGETIGEGKFVDNGEYKLHQSLKMNGTKFRFNGDPNQTVHEITDSTKKLIFNYKSGRRNNRVKTKEKNNYGLQYELTVKNENDGNELGWIPLSECNYGNSLVGNPLIDIYGATFSNHPYKTTMKWRRDNEGGASEKIEVLKEVLNDLSYSSKNPAIWETEPKESRDLDIYYETGRTYPIANLGNVDTIEYSNCWSYGNGAESNRIRDDYNAIFVDKGPRVSSTLAEQYGEEKRSSGLIYSGIYNSSSGVNRLNQFIQAEKITKDVNPEYGSIQKLFTRDSDILVLCEDKCLKIYANKDALYNADGSTNLLATHRVLGVSQPFIGDYGISENPESFASYGFRAYFTDKRRGAVLRLSRDGLTNLAYKGMRDYFSDNLKQPKTIFGNYDDKKDNYNVSLIGSSTHTISFTELTGGWTSFKSFIPEGGLSLNNVYYTFYNGDLWEHNKNSLRNNFYGAQYDSTIKLMFNDAPSSIKNFKTLNYEGTTSRLYKTVERGFAAGNDTTIDLEGWYCNTITTGEQDADVPYFINKEGKWFANLHGAAITTTDLQSAEAAKEFKVQGIGNCSTCTGTSRGGYTLKITCVMDASDDLSDNDFDIPTSFTISGITYDNITSIKTYNNGVTVATNAIFTFEPKNANTGDASVMQAADFGFVSENSSIVTNAVTDGSVAFADTTSAYAADNKVTMTVPLLFQIAGNDQTIELRITGAAKHVNTVQGKWYSIVDGTTGTSNTDGTAFSASGVAGSTVTIDLDPSDGSVTTQTFTAATDYIFKEGNHPFIDLKECYLDGSYYRVTETPVFGSTGDISSKVFALTYKMPDHNITNDIIYFYANAGVDSTRTTNQITNYTIDGVGVSDFTTTITTGATNATQTVASTDNLKIGMSMSGDGIPRGALVTVSSITSTTVVLSESIKTTGGDTYTFVDPNVISVNGVSGKSLKVYGDAGVKFNIYLTTNSDGSSLLTDVNDDTVSSIEGQIPAAGSGAFYEELLDFPAIKTGSESYTLKLEEIPGISVFVDRLSSPEYVTFVQYINTTVTLTASESNSAWSLSATALGTSTNRAFLEPLVADTITLSTVLTSSTADANFKFKDSVDSTGDGITDAFNEGDWSYRSHNSLLNTITLSNGTILSFSNLNLIVDNTISNATATLSGTANVIEYGALDDTSVLNFDNLFGFEALSNPGLIGTSVGTGIYDIPITVGTAAGVFEVSFNAGAIADRFQILFDTDGISDDIADMEVVADSLHVGDYLHVAGTGTNSRGEFREGATSYVGAIGEHTGVQKYMYVGTGGNSSLGYSMAGFWDTNGTTNLVITAADIAGPDSNTPGSDVRASGASNHGNQVGCTNYYYNSASDFIAGTKQTHPSPNIYSDDGNVTLTYTKGVTTSIRAYIRVRSYSGHNSSTTGWFIYGHKFTT